MCYRRLNRSNFNLTTDAELRFEALAWGEPPPAGLQGPFDLVLGSAVAFAPEVSVRSLKNVEIVGTVDLDILTLCILT